MEQKIKVDVIFRVDTTKDFKGTVFALFPYMLESNGLVTSYQHIGQHSSAHLKHCIKHSKQANESEYSDLKKELESIGYELNIIQYEGDLITFFEENSFRINLYEEDNIKGTCAELENWTNGGINMIANLVPFTKDNFIEYVETFNIDNEIDLHRQDSLFRNCFSVKQSLKEFTDYHKMLVRVANKLKKLK